MKPIQNRVSDNTCEKLPCFVDMLSFYVHVFNFSNVISEMAVKRQSPAQRGVRISSRISLDFDEDAQRMNLGRFSPQSSDSRRYFCETSISVYCR